MPKLIQVRNVPNDVHGRVKAHAALAGLSLSDYVLREIEASGARPTHEELFSRIARLPHIDLDSPSANVVRQYRDNLTAYDAAYVTLAEALSVPLLTMDRRLAQAPGLAIDVEVFTPPS